jgi:hypothetical protein
MNWEAMGTVGEIVGAIAVAVTLIYLAVQVKQAKQEITAVGMQARANHAKGVLDPIYMSPQLTSVIAKVDFVNYGEFDLTKEEMITFGAWCHTWMQAEQGSYYLLPNGTHDELRKWWLSTKPGLEFWEKNKGIYDHEFVAYIEGLKSEINAEARSSLEIMSGAN